MAIMGSPSRHEQVGRAVRRPLERADWRVQEGYDRIPPVGFNPLRQQRRRPSDYLMVAAAFAVVAVLLIWALLPR
jgi:hypothetical protein